MIIEENWPHAKALAADLAKLFDEDEFDQFKPMLDKANEAIDVRLKHSKKS